jgi:hypothetical protein
MKTEGMAVPQIDATDIPLPNTLTNWVPEISLNN